MSITDLKAQIALELYAAIEKLGGKSDLLAIVGSYGDTQNDEWVLEALRLWNSQHSREQRPSQD